MRLATWFGFAMPDVRLIHHIQHQCLLAPSETGTVRDALNRYPQVPKGGFSAVWLGTPPFEPGPVMDWTLAQQRHDTGSIAGQVFSRLRQLIRARATTGSERLPGRSRRCGRCCS